jgi:type IV pilus assembly protein PilP
MNKIALTFLIAFLYFLLTAMFLFAADDKSPSYVVPAATATQRPETKGQIAKEVQSSDNTYSYNPLSKPDPFRPFIDEVLVTKKKEEKKDMSSIFPLQRAEADKFRVVGIAGDYQRRVAIVEDAAKKFYPIFIGTHIGIHNGKVTEILPDRVIVAEYEKEKVKRIILKLRKN